MKALRNSIVRIATAIMVGIGSVTLYNPTTVSAQNINISYNDFYQGLAPYGQWYNDPMYGYVWQPYVDAGFRPYYTNGYWVMTEYGNMWVSNYEWGWAPFHYGRWTMGNYGWIWVPGNEWAPAWVDWRQANGYYGWAPMAPGININVYFGTGYNTPFDWFTFVTYNNMYNRNFYYYNAPRSVRNNHRLTRITNTYRGPRNNNMYAYGPRRDDIQRVTNRSVPVYNINDARTQGGPRVSGNTVNVYNPRVTNSSNSVRPTNVRDISEAGQRGTRNTNTAIETRNNNTSNTGTRTNNTTVNTRSNNTSTTRNTNSSTSTNTRTAVQPVSTAPTRSTEVNRVTSPRTEVNNSRSNNTRSTPATSTPTRNSSSSNNTPSRSVQSNNTAPSRSQVAPSNNSSQRSSGSTGSSRSAERR